MASLLGWLAYAYAAFILLFMLVGGIFAGLNNYKKRRDKRATRGPVKQRNKNRNEE
jgi:hypothetical protein